MPQKSSTRPTKSILKESFFNSAGTEIVGSVFVEVFGGSGSMGLEALSLGAEQAYFIERDREAFGVLEKNINLIDKERGVAIRGDSFEEFGRLVPKVSCEDALVLYFDPPFDIREGMGDVYEKSIALLESVAEEALRVAAYEHSSKIVMPERIGAFARTKVKRFGKSTLSYYRSA